MKELEIKGRLDRIGKTTLEHFQDIKELEVADGPVITVEDLLPYKCEQVEKSLKALEIIKKKPQAELSLIQLGKIKTYEEYLYYTGKWELDLYGDMVYTQEEFNLLKAVLE